MQELIYEIFGKRRSILKSVGVRVSLEEKEMRVLASALALALTLTLFLYPERDLNPHNRYGHRILSPACLPFHHPGGIIFCYLNLIKNPRPACRTLSRFSGNSTIRANFCRAVVQSCSRAVVQSVVEVQI